MKKISLNNGMTYMHAEAAIEEINDRDLWDVVIASMDDETREKVHAELAPCTEKEFLERYLEISDQDIVVG